MSIPETNRLTQQNRVANESTSTSAVPVVLPDDNAPDFHSEMKEVNSPWRTPKYQLPFRILAVGADLLVKNIMILIATTFDAVTLGKISLLNRHVNNNKNPVENNILGSEFIIFMKILNKDAKFCYSKNGGKEHFPVPTVYEFHRSFDAAAGLLKSDQSGFRRVVVSRACFLAIGLETLVSQVVCIAVAPLATFAATICLGRNKKFNAAALSLLCSTNMLHTAIHTLRLTLNPYAQFKPGMLLLDDTDDASHKSGMLLLDEQDNASQAAKADGKDVAGRYRFGGKEYKDLADALEAYNAAKADIANNGGTSTVPYPDKITDTPKIAE